MNLKKLTGLNHFPPYLWIPMTVLALLTGWRIYSKQAEASALAATQAARLSAPPVVNVTPVLRRDVVSSFDAVGSVEAPFNVRISSTVTGPITFLRVREGDSVRRGEVLVRIDPSAVEAEVNQAQSALAQAKFRHAQALTTQNTNDVSVGSQVLQAQAALATAEADSNQVRQSYASQLASAAATVADAVGKVNIADAAIANAQASLNNASAKYNRVLELQRQGFVTTQDVDDARTAYEVQGAQMRSARALRASAQAQKHSAESGQAIVRNKSRADLASAQARVTQARAVLAAARANTSQVGAYQQNLAALQAGVDAAEAALRNAQARLAYTILRSSIDGYVTSRMMDPGAVATSGQQILAIQSSDPLWVTIPVPEEVNRHIYLHLAANVQLDALPGQVFAGRVVQVNAAADPVSRQFLVRVQLENAKRQIKPGMFAHVTAVLGRVPRALCVPREAIQKDKDGSYVMVVDGADAVHRRSVEVGASDADGFVAKSGLEAGERVVVVSMTRLRDGQKVRVVAQDETLGRASPAAISTAPSATPSRAPDKVR